MNNPGTSAHDYTRITPKFQVCSYVGPALADNTFAERPILIPTFFEMNASNSYHDLGLILLLVGSRGGKNSRTHGALSRLPSADIRAIDEAFWVMEADLEESN